MDIQGNGGSETEARYVGARIDSWLSKESPTWVRYTAAIVSVGLAMLLDKADLLSGGFRIYLVFYPFIIIATLFGGFGPGLLATALSALGATFFLVEPVGRLAVASRADMISMNMFLGGSVFVVWVCDRLRVAIGRVAQAEARMESAAELARKAQLIKETEERLSMAQKAGDVGVFDWDIPNDKVAWTPEQEELFGIPSGEFRGNYADWAKRVHPEDEPRLALFFQEWMQSGPEKQSWEYRILRSDGETRWVAARGVLARDKDGEPVRMIGTNRDITEKKRTDEALRDSESRCWTIFETVVDAMIIIDEQGIIESVNPAAVKLFGYHADEMRGKNVKLLMPSPYHERHDEYLENYRRTGVKKIIGIGREVTARHKDGSTFPIRLAVSEMRVGEQRIFIGQIHDITERKRAEMELEAALTRERAAHRAGEPAKPQFHYLFESAPSLSRDFKASLRAAGTLAKIMRSDRVKNLGREGRQNLAAMLKCMWRIDRMIDAVLRHSRIGPKGSVSGASQGEESRSTEARGS